MSSDTLGSLWELVYCGSNLESMRLPAVLLPLFKRTVVYDHDYNRACHDCI